jgi:hypothetical protein
LLHLISVVLLPAKTFADEAMPIVAGLISPAASRIWL